MKRKVFFASGLFAIAAAGACSACDKDPVGPQAPVPSSTGISDGAAVLPPSSDGGATPGTTATSPQPDPPPPDPPKVDVTNESIDVNGKKREYVLVVPKAYDANRVYPLVFVFHGDGGAGPSMRAFHTFDNESASDAIVVYPTGALDPAWDLELSDNNRDFQFLQQMLTTLKGKYNIDGSRVFGTGYSSGGFFISFAQCHLGLFRAISSYAGGAPYTNDPNNPVPTCASDKPVAAIVFHGDQDNTVPLSSGKWDAQYWAGRNGCTVSDGEPSLTVAPPPCKAYAGCPTERPVELCVIEGLGHLPWSNGAKTTWAFFKGLP